ncbi:MAG: hypothetical protein M5R36_26130 [Deltaproteobacteria bacterium]|nr:hypothetical protein [Deltaproteobacteria bacterium]
MHEPEPGLIDFDPRRNVVTYRPDGPGNLDYYGMITGDWTLVDVGRLNEEAAAQEDIRDVDTEGEPEEDPSNY